MRAIPYRILSDRLSLRCLANADVLVLHHALLCSREHLDRFMPFPAEPVTVGFVANMVRNHRAGFRRGDRFVYGVFGRDDALLGCAGLDRRSDDGGMSLGYWVHVDHTRRGFAREAASVLTEVALGIARAPYVEIRCDLDNVASIRIAEGLGYQPVPTPGLDDALTWRRTFDPGSRLPGARAGQARDRAANESRGSMPRTQVIRGRASAR